MADTSTTSTNPGLLAVEEAQGTLAHAILTNDESVPRNDLEAARMIARHCRTDQAWLSYRATSRTGGEWLAWDSTVHVTVPQELDYLLATGMADVMELAVNSLRQADKDDPIKKAAIAGRTRWASRTGIEHLRALIRAELRVAQDHFDKEKRFVPMSDGRLLDLTDLHAEPLPPDPRNPVTRKLGTTTFFEEGAPPRLAVRWVEWLSVFVPDITEQRFLQECAGAALIGRGDAKCIVHLIGRRHTGKSTYLNLMSMVFGLPDQNGFSGDLANGAIVAKYGGSTNFNQASAKGVRFLTLSEPSTQPTDDSFLKSISGSRDPIRTEKKGQNEDRWYSECVLHIAANDLVRFNTRDKAIVERINIIEFKNVVEPDEDQPNFEADLFAAEGDAILAWLIEGAERYMAHGIAIPESVRKRAEENVVHESSVLRWFTQRIEEERYAIDKSTLLTRHLEAKVGYENYKQWVQDEGGVRHFAHQGQWLSELESYLQMPSDRKGTRPGGKPRVWGVIDPVALQLLDEMESANPHTSVTQWLHKNVPVKTPPGY